MAIDFAFFEKLKSEMIWTPVLEWIKGTGSVKHFAWKAYKGTPGSGGVPFFFLYVNINEQNRAVSISLYANVMRHPTGKGQKLIDNVLIGENPSVEQISSIMRDKYNIRTDKSESLLQKFMSVNRALETQDISQGEGASPSFQKTKEHKLYNHEKNLIASIRVTQLLFFSNITHKRERLYQARAYLLNWKTGKLSEKTSLGKPDLSPERANEEFNNLISTYKSLGFDEYAEAAVKAMEADFDKAFEKVDVQVNEKIQAMEETDEEESLYDMAVKNKTESNNNKTIKKAQSEWYAGALPDPKNIERYIGTPSVDASQLKSVFIGVDDAISLVNRFDSSLLINVGFIFNFSNQGAYGVYLPALDDKIKREKIKSILKQQGCTINENPDGSFYAYHENKTPEEIQKEIDREYGQLSSYGGTVFGINMNKVLMASQADARDIGTTDNEDLKDIILMHLGATIVHEAIHAKGRNSEGPSESGEEKFIEFVLPIINQKRLQRYKSKGLEQDFTPLQITPGVRRSSSISWLKKAYSTPSGAMFSGEMPSFMNDKWSQMGMGLSFAKPGPIETMLQNVRDLTNEAQNHIVTEKQMRVQEEVQQKTFEIDKDFPHIEDLLERDRDEFVSYNATEKLLEERRPSPLMSTKKASSLINSGLNKTATFFGWMNNLDLPMRERVIPAEDSDEFLNFDWSEIRGLPRYNYDGNSYVFCEPRQNSPELWEQMIQNRPSYFINPARRFASAKAINIHDPRCIINVLRVVEYHIENKKFLGSRILVSEDLIDNIALFFKNSKNITVYVDRNNYRFINDEKIFPGWIFRKSVPEDIIKIIEEYSCKKNNSVEAKKMYEYVVGLSSIKKEIIEKIINGAKNICNEFGIKDAFIVGGFPRSIVMKESYNNVHDLDFSAAWPDQCIKLGGMLADELGVSETEIFHRTMTLSWEWMGIKCDFKGHFSPIDIRKLLRDNGIKTTPLNLDVYSRDFTINMLVYDINKAIVYDVCRQSVSDINGKLLRTFFPQTDYIVKQNPIIILRAIKYMIRYDFNVELELSRAMAENKALLFDGRYSDERLEIGLCELFEEGKEKAKSLIAKFGLEDIYKIKKELNNASTN